MTVQLPDGKNPPHVQARRLEAERLLTRTAENVANARQELSSMHDKTRLNTMEFTYAAERVDAAWRNLQEALANLRL